MCAMECAQRHFLRAERDRLARVYVAAHSILTANTETTQATDYNRLRLAAEEARLDLTLAELELEQHTQEHSKAN
jgi:hypothetical protein